jgi:hypothetical protein
MNVSRHSGSLLAIALLIAPAGALAAKPAGGGSQGSTTGAASPASTGGATPSATPAANTTAASAAAASPTTASFESQMLAYGAVEKIAKNVAGTVCNRLPSVLPPQAPAVSSHQTVVIYDQSAFATVLAFSSFVQNAKLIESAYSTLVTPTSNTLTVGVAAESGGRRSRRRSPTSIRRATSRATRSRSA